MEQLAYKNKGIKRKYVFFEKNNNQFAQKQYDNSINEWRNKKKMDILSKPPKRDRRVSELYPGSSVLINSLQFVAQCLV